jgi:putative chitinase
MATDTIKAITAEQLKKIFPNGDDDYLATVASELSTNLAGYGLGSALRLAHFFGQVRQEAGPKLAAGEEDLRYQQTALLKFSYYQSHRDEAQQDGYAYDPVSHALIRKGNDVAIGNKCYGGNPGLGNRGVDSGDGYNYRGRGFIQITGRYNYGKLNDQYKLTYGATDIDFLATPDAAKQFPYTVRSAVCYWLWNHLPEKADLGSLPANVNAITDVINRGTDQNSRQNRINNFKLAYGVFQ